MDNSKFFIYLLVMAGVTYLVRAIPMALIKEKIKNKWKLAYHIRNTAYFGHKYGKNIWVRHFAAMPFLLRMYAAITFNFIKGHKYSFSDYGLFWNMMRRGVREELGKM